jgi:glycosyltransferase involved in cell wall biosynthesis
MKVLHYVAGFSLPSETFIFDLIKNLENNGIENYVLTHERYLLDERPFEKVKVTNENVNFIKKVYYKLFDSWSVRNKTDVLNFIIKYNPDVVHAHFGLNGVKLASLILKEKIQTLMVISMHGTDTTQYPLKHAKYKKMLRMLSTKKSVVFTFPSIFLINEFKKNVGIELLQNAFILPNSCNPIFFVKDVQVANEKKIRIISIGRLIYCKGYSDLLEAVALLNKEWQNWELSIVGDGEEMEKLKNKAQDLGIYDKVNFHGFVKHADVARLLRASSIYVQPSVVDPQTRQAESFGVSVVEAIVSGLPVVVTNVGGLPDTVLGGDDLCVKIVKPNAPYEICEAIKILAKEKHNNKIYRNKVIATYSQETQIKNILDIYNKHQDGLYVKKLVANR